MHTAVLLAGIHGKAMETDGFIDDSKYLEKERQVLGVKSPSAWRKISKRLA